MIDDVTQMILSRLDRFELNIQERLDGLVLGLNDHEKRLVALESIEVKKLSERVQELERDKSHIKGVAAGVAFAAALGGGTIATAIANVLK